MWGSEVCDVRVLYHVAGLVGSLPFQGHGSSKCVLSSVVSVAMRRPAGVRTPPEDLLGLSGGPTGNRALWRGHLSQQAAVGVLLLLC